MRLFINAFPLIFIYFMRKIILKSECCSSSYMLRNVFVSCLLLCITSVSLYFIYSRQWHKVQLLLLLLFFARWVEMEWNVVTLLVHFYKPYKIAVWNYWIMANGILFHFHLDSYSSMKHICTALYMFSSIYKYR